VAGPRGEGAIGAVHKIQSDKWRNFYFWECSSDETFCRDDESAISRSELDYDYLLLCGQFSGE